MSEADRLSLDCWLEYRADDFSLACDIRADSPCFIGLFGSSGSGKSTLLRLLAGLIKPDRGHIRVGNRQWHGAGYYLPPHQRRVGYVFQDARLFPHLNVLKNLLFGVYQRRLRVDDGYLNDVLQVLDLFPLLRRFPHQLSGGQQQRVAIGRALLSRPRLLLLDEPLSGLDLSAKAEIMPYLERIHRLNRLLTFYVSHDWHEMARLTDRVMVLRNGQIIADGDTGSLAHQLALCGGYLPEHAPVNVFDVRVGRYDKQRQLLQVHHEKAKLWVPVTNQPWQPGDTVRIMLAAADIALAATPPADTSFLNTLSGYVTHIAEPQNGVCLVAVRHDSLDLLASVSAASVNALGLTEGKRVTALVKGSRIV